MAIAKRLSAALLALAVIIGLAVQPVLPVWAAPVAMPMSAPGPSAQSDEQPITPCKQATPICIEHVGCVTAIAVPASPRALGVPIRWHTVSYDLAVPHLTGRSVEPELSPPILAS